jgi:chromate transporter
MSPSISDLIKVFGRIGLLSFGGPAAQIALMHKELVDERDWLNEASFLRALSLCMLLPGPEAMQLATYAGWRLRGVTGGLIGGGLFVLPGALVIGLLVWLYVQFGDLPLVQHAFLGIKAAVVVIVIQALQKVAAKALTQRTGWIIAGLSFCGIFALNLPFPLIIALSGIWGWWSARNTLAEPVDAPVPAARTALRTVLIWLPLWLAPLIALSLGGADLLAAIGWFFAKLAVVTFGGAYAVLAYMTQTVVIEQHWLSTGQMIDALGLAETTPGPLILVTQFVAMLTGFEQGGVALALVAGIVALWATFVPCFLWIFVAGPYVEHIAGRPRLSAALNAITAAVVGVILNLSLWFALHVVFGTVGQANLGPLSVAWPDWSTLDLRALCLIGVSALCLLALRLKMGLSLALVATCSTIWGLSIA